MKKRILALLLVMMLSLLAFTSCWGGGEENPPDDPNKPGDGPGEVPDDGKDDVIYSKDTDIYVVYDNSADNWDFVASVRDAVKKVNAKVEAIHDTVDKKAHEIVFGRTSRAISTAAYAALDEVERKGDYPAAFLIYSDGTSVAIAYDEDDYGTDHAARAAIEYCIKNYFGSSELKLKAGTAYSAVIDVIEYQAAIDEKLDAERWATFTANIAKTAGAEQAAKITESMQKLYGLFGDGAVSWLANLYDPAVGGFYYSNSGRDAIGFLPDLESTYQAIAFMSSSGLAQNIATPYDIVSPEMAEQIVYFVKSLQDPNGYFYHPQWGKELTDRSYHSRRGRDLEWATRLLNRFNAKPTYDTPYGAKGDGILADGTPAPAAFLTGRLGASAASAVSYVVAANADADANVPYYMQNDVNFKAYLAALDINKNSYEVGNTLESVSRQIVARDKVLAQRGESYRLCDILKAYLDEHQNPATGMWTLYNDIDYAGVNGLLKISATYNNIGKEIPNVANAMRSAMAGITIADAPTTVCYVLNPWYAITNILTNVEQYNTSANQAEVAKDVEALRAEIMANAVELIDVTARKTGAFLKSDGSFSYFPETSGPNSQGLPVAIQGSKEGDVNASYMFIVGTPHHIFTILGEQMIPVYSEADRLVMLDIFAGLTPVVKDEQVAAEPETYEDYDTGAVPTDLQVTIQSSGGGASVVEADGPDGTLGKVLAITSGAGAADDFRFMMLNYDRFFNSVSFEADMKVVSNGGNGTFELNPYGWAGDFIRLFFDYVGGAYVTCRTDDFATVNLAPEGEWFKLRIEYSAPEIDYDMDGDNDLLVKLFVNGKHLATAYSPNSAAKDPTPQPAGSVQAMKLFTWTAVDATIYLDNVLFKQDNVKIDPAPTVNAEDDAEELTFEFSTAENTPKKVYTTLSETGAIKIDTNTKDGEKNKILTLTTVKDGSDLLGFNVTKGADLFNAISFTADFKLTAADDAGKTVIRITSAKNFIGAELVLEYTKGGDIVIKNVDKDGKEECSATLAKEGEWIALKLEYTTKGSAIVLNVYANDTLVLEATKPYDSASMVEGINASDIKVITDAAAAFDVSFDNVKYEQLVITFAPDESANSGIDFEEGALEDVKDLTVEKTDGTTVEIVEDLRDGAPTKVLHIVSGEKQSVIANYTIPEGAGDTVAFEFYFKLTKNCGTTNPYIIYLKDKDGNVAEKFCFGWSKGSLNVFVSQYTSDSSKDLDVVVGAAETWLKIRIEYTNTAEGGASFTLSVNDDPAKTWTKTSTYNSSDINAADITTVTLAAETPRVTDVYIDNISGARLDSSLIDFEHKDLEGVKDHLTANKTDGTTVEIVEDLRDGETTKALHVVSGEKQSVILDYSIPAGEGNSVAFEFYFKLTKNCGTTNPYIIYLKDKDGNVAEKFCFGWSKSSLNVFISQYTSDSSKDLDVVIGAAETWLKLRFEYTNTAEGGASFTVSVNDDPAKTWTRTSTYNSSDINASDITSIVLASEGSRVTDVYFDDMIVYRTTAD